MPESEGVCAVIVAYNCGAGVEPTFRSVHSQVDRVVFVDNGSGEETVLALEKIRSLHPETVEVRRIETNAGIAAALNVGVKRAIALGFPWVLTMDHDSEAESGMVESMISAWRRYPDRDRVLIFAPVFIDRGAMSRGEIVRFEGWEKIRLSPDVRDEVLRPTVVITSGNLLRAALYERVGPFDEKLFIDYVDHDFCLRGVRMGFEILCAPKARLLHSVGDVAVRRLFGRTWSSTNHSPARRYTIGRNRLEMIRRYRTDFPGYAWRIATEFPRDFLAILVCERDWAEKWKMMGKGMWDSARYFGRNS